MKSKIVGFYYKQFFFFVALIIICVVAYILVYRHVTSASLADEVNLDYSKGSYQLDLEILADGNVKVGDHVYKNIIVPLADYDQFKYIAFSEEGVYLTQLQIIIHLPQPIEESQFHPRTYAVHGVGSFTEELRDNQTVVFTADDLAPAATYTVELQLPKDIIHFLWYRQVVFGLSDLSFTFWILISLIPLAITLLIVFYIYHKTSISWTVKNIKETIDSPPENLSPAEASVLLDDKITPRAIAATFIDLAQKGKINIVDHKNYFTFSKAFGFGKGLKKFEAILLSKIFTPNQKIVYQEDIEFRIGHHIFSRKMAQIYLEIYNTLFNKNYFIKNPASWQGSFRRTGYLMFFVGLFGFILNIIFLSSIIYMLLIWFTVMVGAGFLIKISPQLPARTEEGIVQTRQWVKFKNFLAAPTAFGYFNESQKIYEKYLAYAVAFGVESTWTHRFIDHPFQMPGWLISDRKTILLEDLINEVIPFINFVSSKLARAKEPSA